MSLKQAHQRPSLLFLSQTLPFPPDGGVNIRTYNVLRLLARQFSVTGLCFYRRSERPSATAVADSVQRLSELAQVEAFPIPQEHSRIRLLADHAISVARRRAYTLRMHASRSYRTRLAEILAQGGIDIVHMDSLDLAHYLPSLQGLPVVCTHHNVESQLLRRRAISEPSLWRRKYLQKQAEWVQDLERQWCGRVALNVAVSEPDRQEFVRIAPQGRFCVVPNGVDVEYFHPVDRPSEGIVFVGGVTWFPNRDALDYFCHGILPLVRASGNNPSVRWVGRSTETERNHYARHHGVELTGYLADVRPSIAGAACYVVPLRVGGGTRLKILDAWAMGKAVVSTSMGCEGLHAVDGENIVIRDTPASFAQAVADVLLDSNLRERLGRAARLTAERLYSWEVIGAEINRLYLPLVAANRRS